MVWAALAVRVSAGVTAAQALEVQRRKHHELEGRKLGIPGFETAGEELVIEACVARRHHYEIPGADRGAEKEAQPLIANMKPCSSRFQEFFRRLRLDRRDLQ